MGVSTDAILAYGVDCGEDSPLRALNGPEPDYESDPAAYDAWHDSDPPELDEYLAGLAGHENPYNAVPLEIMKGSSAEYEEWKRAHPDHDAATTEWFKVCREAEIAAPIEIVHHCSYDYSMYIVAAKGTVTTARRGYPEGLGQSVARPDIAAIDQARKFLSAHMPSVNFSDPQWLLFSMWG